MADSHDVRPPARDPARAGAAAARSALHVRPAGGISLSAARQADARAGGAVDLSVVVPVYNNAATLPELIDRLQAVVDSLGLATELIFVDDGSTDASAAVVTDRAAHDGRIRLLRLARNFGGQAALCAGFAAAGGRRTVCLDADLENFPEDIPALLAALDRGADLACGVRPTRGLSWRGMASALLNAYARSRLSRPVRDLGCGMRAMDSRLVHNLESAGDRRRLLTPLLLERAGEAVEVPIRWAPSPSSGGHSFASLLAIALDYFMLTANRPFLMIGLAALVGATSGAALLIAAAIAASSVLALAGLVLASAGAVGMATALVGEYVQRIYQHGQGESLYALGEEPGEGAER